MVLISFFLRSWLGDENNFVLVCLVPLISFAADTFENSIIVLLLSFYPQKLMFLASLVSYITKIKWLANYFDWTLVLVSMMGAFKSFIKRKLDSNSNNI